VIAHDDYLNDEEDDDDVDDVDYDADADYRKMGMINPLDECQSCIVVDYELEQSSLIVEKPTSVVDANLDENEDGHHSYDKAGYDYGHLFVSVFGAEYQVSS